MIRLYFLQPPISMVPGVWRYSGPTSGRWLIWTHKGPREIDYGDVVLRLGRRTWVWRR